MISKINKFVSVAIIVGLTLYVVLLNREFTTVYLAPEKSVSATTGLILIGAFGLGVLCAALVGIFFGIKAHFRERRLQNKERQRQIFYQGMLKARNYLAAGDWSKARDQWERIVKQDPTDIIARVALSQSLEGAGEVREALKVLDAARAADPNSTEVLFRAAELNLILDNKTAAIDNLALILYNQPNLKAAKMARDLSEQLERIEDALEYQREVENLGGANEESKAIRSKLEFKQLLRDTKEDPAIRAEAVKKFVKRSPEFVPALQELANLEASRGRTDEAAQLLIRAGKQSGSFSYWHQAAKLWIDNNLPDRALSAIRTAAKETKGVARLEAELHLARLYLSLNMVEEARNALDRLADLARSEELEVPADLLREKLLLKGRCLTLLGETKQSAEVWRQLTDHDYQIEIKHIEAHFGSNGNQPEPRLSTP